MSGKWWHNQPPILFALIITFVHSSPPSSHMSPNIPSWRFLRTTIALSYFLHRDEGEVVFRFSTNQSVCTDHTHLKLTLTLSKYLTKLNQERKGDKIKIVGPQFCHNMIGLKSLTPLYLLRSGHVSNSGAGLQQNF